MDLDKYQRRALKTSKFGKANNPRTAIAPMLGLAGATGTILDLYKRYFNDQLKLTEHRDYLRDELGDLLWYVAVVAQTFNLTLSEIATANVEKTEDRYGDADVQPLGLDQQFPETERFPRRLVVEFGERDDGGRLIASLRLVEARPNAFPEGPIARDGGKVSGYDVGAPLGDEVDDNARRVDDYRYHDAIHMGFMAVLGWSPICRALLRIKRKSDPDVDRIEDGARAIYLEEGLAAALFRLSTRRGNFLDERTIDGETLGLVKSLVRELEVEDVPGRLWRRAINQGFRALRELGENHGGFLIADLDNQTLAYEKAYEPEAA